MTIILQGNDVFSGWIGFMVTPSSVNRSGLSQYTFQYTNVPAGYQQKEVDPL